MLLTIDLYEDLIEIEGIAEASQLSLQHASVQVGQRQFGQYRANFPPYDKTYTYPLSARPLNGPSDTESRCLTPLDENMLSSIEDANAGTRVHSHYELRFSY